MAMEVIPTGAALGAEVRGLDLTGPLDAEAFDDVGLGIWLEFLRVDAVLDHVDAVALDRRVGGLDVVDHGCGDGDHGIGALEGRLLDPA